MINNAKTIKLESIRKNLETRYELLGLNITVPDFERYVNQFIESTDFTFTGFIDYPETGKYGKNLLDKGKTNYATGRHSLKAMTGEIDFEFLLERDQENPGPNKLNIFVYENDAIEPTWSKEITVN